MHESTPPTRCRWGSVFAALVLAGGVPAAQAPVPSRPDITTFEVASIKPSPPNTTFTRPGNAMPGGRWTAANTTVIMLLQRAYPDFAQPGLIVGGPRWLQDDRFDVEAKAAGDVPRDLMLRLVQQLLADRFSLRSHVERRDIDVYALAVARNDGRLGPRLKPASPECITEVEAFRARVKAQGGGTFSGGTGIQMPCGGDMSLVKGLVRMRGAREVGSILPALQAWLDRPMVDRTGLSGLYEMDLEFDFGTTLPPGTVGTSDTAGPSIFTALQEQLGLKLERRREPRDVLVIDAVERPTPN